MREIKYRLWHLEDKKYYIVYCLQFCDEFNEPLNYEAAQIRRNDQWEWIEKDKYILEEFTGLKDKNGKEIYEGDKITLNYGIPPRVDTLIIEYADNEIVADISVSGWWMRNTRKNGCSSSLCKTYENDLEIIGTIHSE